MDEIYKMDEIISLVIGWLDRWHILESKNNSRFGLILISSLGFLRF